MTTIEITDNFELLESPAKYVDWKIPNFFELPTEFDYLRSPLFSLTGVGEKWFIEIFPNGSISPGWIILGLCKERSAVEHLVDFKMGIKKVDGSELKSFAINETFDMDGDWWGDNLIERSDLLHSKDGVAPDGTLTVFCSATIVDESQLVPSTTEAGSQTPMTVETAEVASPITSSEGILIQNFKDLYFSKHGADVTITVKGREFLAHKSVLSARSTVFSSMFNKDMAEDNGKIEITDCDPDSFEDFLLFLYTGTLDVVTSSNATSLYKSSDKYDLKELKEECVSCMIRELTVDSFCDVLQLGVMYNETDLLHVTTDFFIENAKDILVTIEWLEISAENPSLGNELFLKYVNKDAQENEE